MAATQKMNFLTLVSYSLLQTLFARTYRFATIQNVTDDDRQTTDRQTTHRAKGTTDTVGQKPGIPVPVDIVPIPHHTRPIRHYPTRPIPAGWVGYTRGY